MRRSILNQLRLLTTTIVAMLFLLPVVPASAQESTDASWADTAVQMATPSSAPTLMITIDSPAAGGQWSAGQSVTISGWTADPSGPATGVAAVYAYLDTPASSGQGRIEATTRTTARPDVALAYGRSDWTNVGYEIPWTVGTLAPGQHTLYVYADANTGSVDNFGTVTFNVSTAAPLAVAPVPSSPAPAVVAAVPATTTANGMVHFQSPVNGDNVVGTVTVGVVAVDCSTGAMPTRVQLLDGSSTGQVLVTATDAFTRQVTSACTGQTSSPGGQFNLSLNTQSLSDGMHTIVAVADITGGTVNSSLNLGVYNNGNLNSANNLENCNPYYPNYNSSYPTNRPCSGLNNQNCNPYYPNYNSSYPTNQPCFGNSNPNCMAFSAGQACSSNYNQNCNSSYPSYNSGYPTNQACSGNYSQNCNPYYPQANSSYPSNAPCSGTGTSQSCNPYYPSAMAGYTNTPCSGQGTSQVCNPYYPTAVAGYSNTPCGGSTMSNCNPSYPFTNLNYPNNVPCVQGGLTPSVGAERASEDLTL